MRAASPNISKEHLLASKKGEDLSPVMSSQKTNSLLNTFIANLVASLTVSSPSFLLKDISQFLEE